LFEINERGTFQDPKKLTEELKGAQDNEIFQIARLVNCGWFGAGKWSTNMYSISD
jgi:linoleate 10R-lipoxygenase